MMMRVTEREGHPDWTVYAAFVALAIWAGPVGGYVSSAMLVATNAQMFAGTALASLLSGVGLTYLAISQKESMLRAGQWKFLLLLLAPQWCAVPIGLAAGSVPWLHGIGEGAVFLLSLAAPLWLGLVAATDLLQIEVPVGTVAAAIAGMGAVLLVIPASLYALRWVQAPMMLLQIVLGIATVASWAIARRGLEGLPIAATAGGYLLLSGAGNACFAWLYERGSWQPMDWRGLIVPLLCQAALLAVVWCLWFWLLQRITLGAFGMRALAAWAATAVPVFVTVGLLQWRVDAAVAIAVVAIAVALRARASDEQPTALGLGGV
jgi:hypothetical protein